jgi:hypothetical protein
LASTKVQTLTPLLVQNHVLTQTANTVTNRKY